ncbi:unnamed protein product [Malus baccata var. baccata]
MKIALIITLYYVAQLIAQVGCCNLQQGLPFHGHDESFKSSNRGNYLENMQFLADHNDKVRKVVFENAPKNLKYTYSDIQKDHGQGYNGASNMKGELNGLKAKILNKYPQTFYVHCFAHQLQVALVAIAKGIEGVAIFFNNASILVNTIGSSCKRCDAFREKQLEQIKKALDIGDLETAVVEVLEWIKDDTNQDNFGEVNSHWELQMSYHKHYIVNAMTLAEVCKQRLQSLRDDDFADLLDDVQKFCQDHDIVIPNMEDLRFVAGKSRRKAPRLTNFHYYRVDLYFQVLDTQLKELNDRFNKMHSEFSSLRGIGDLSKELVQTGRCASYMLVYKLLTLALVLSVATTLVDRAFSAMKIVKTPLRNKMGNQWLSDNMLVYIGRY